MPKKIRDYMDLYIAKDILGKSENGNKIVIDEQNNSNKLNPTNLDDKILIYERQVKGWFLDCAKKLRDESDDNDFIVLMICMSYIEGIIQYKEGMSSDGKSQKMFIKSIKDIYSNINFKNSDLKRLYSQSRCGLFHNGMVSSDIILRNDFLDAIEINNVNRNGSDDIKINPSKLLDDIINHFDEYIRNLKQINNSELRRKFDSMYSVV
ncbi:hypothetical protein O8C80_06300 [Aliarcobacter butzleri]|uniref:hypothetical protein n=1 Tax=Aliarcobacter butzleri TaxID=28197 RepID=UPI00263C77C6|nr:hypothetical protein [Aliarcobacter butzleri]MDN5042952.1 hypothetical protein [Aliarcobacter butzleri]